MPRTARNNQSSAPSHPRKTPIQDQPTSTTSNGVDSGQGNGKKRTFDSIPSSSSSSSSSPSEPAIATTTDIAPESDPHLKSRRSSRTSLPNPSPPKHSGRKSKGKGRKLPSPSPPPSPPSPPVEVEGEGGESAPPQSKRQKFFQSTSSTLDTNIKGDYNLRSRKSLILPQTDTTTTTTMPTARKGSRASRAAKAKQRALDDEQQQQQQRQEEEGDIQMNGGGGGGGGEVVDAGEGEASTSTSGGEKEKEKEKMDIVEEGGGVGKGEEEEVEVEMEVTGGGGGGGDSDGNDEDEDDSEPEEEEDDDDDDDEEDDDDDEESDGDNDEEEEDAIDDQFIPNEEFLASPHSHSSDSQPSSSLHDPPQTFDASGSPLSSLSTLDRAAVTAAAAAASSSSGVGESGLFASSSGLGGGGGGGGGGSFGAMRGLMSGMTGRLRGILTKLKERESVNRVVDDDDEEDEEEDDHDEDEDDEDGRRRRRGKKSTTTTTTSSGGGGGGGGGIDSHGKLVALQDLAELLSVSTEDTLAGYFQVEQFVKEIVYVLRGDNNGVKFGGGGGGDDFGGGGGSGMTMEEMLAFGLDPAEHGGGGGGGGGGGTSEENNVQMMLLACRCLANLMEALPGSAHSVVYAGAVPVLCGKLREIQYIDLAEQTLSTLEKISEEVPSSIVREGGLGALLNFLDFFSFHVQRTAVTAAANCCRSLSIESFSMVNDSIPIFQNVLSYPDQRVVEQACLAIVRIVDSYKHYPDKLEDLLSEGLLKAVIGLLNPDSTTVGSGTYTQILKMLTISAKSSARVGIVLIELGIADTLFHLLNGVAPEVEVEVEGEGEKKGTGMEGVEKEMEGQQQDEMRVMQNLVQRSKELIQETLGLVNELLPALPKDGIFDPKAFSGKDRSHRSQPKIKREAITPDLSLPSAASASTSANPAPPAAIGDAVFIKPEPSDDLPALARKPKEVLAEKRIELFNDMDDTTRQKKIKRYYELMLPTLVDVYDASVNATVRNKAVLGLLKITNFCDETTLAKILGNVSMASFLAAILSSRDQSAVVTSALQLVELLLLKMPDAYQYFFRREGVLPEIERIAAAPLVSPTKSKRGSPSRQSLAQSRSNSNSGADAGPSGLTRALQQHAAASSSTNGKGPAASSSVVPAPEAAPATIPTPTLTPAEAQAQDMITLRARHLRDEYSAADSEPAIRARDALQSIKTLVSSLSAVTDHMGAAGPKELEKARALVEKVAALLENVQGPLSSFEMLESGLVDGILKFATEPTSEGLSVVQRQEILAKAFMPQLDHKAATPAFSLLVKRLQDSLSRMEEFEVTLAAPSAGEADSSRRGASSMLSRQLKLRLVAEDGSDVPRSCTNIVVSIHAIATFQAFNDYLRPRILAATALQDRSGAASSAPQPGAGSSLTSFLAAFAAANGSSSPPESSIAGASRLSSSLGAAAASTSTSNPIAVPTRRRSTRLSGKGGAKEEGEASTSKTTLDDEDMHEDQPMDTGDNELCPEDEEMHHDDDDDDEQVFADDFEQPPPSRDERPVNLEVEDDGSKVVAKTPDGTRVSTPSLGKSASSSNPRTSTAPKPRASYAAAVKAEPTDFHLEFSMGPQSIGLDTTVYGAVHRHDATQPITGRNIWHSIYTVTFRKVAGPARPDNERTTPEPASRDESMLTSLPKSIPAESQQAKIFQLLWVLHNINSDYGDLAEGATPGLPERAFVNNKLTAKMNRQLEEPMVVASACLPEWAVDLPQFFPFLFPFDTRYTFLQSTAFGYARLMQKWVVNGSRSDSRRDENLGFLGRLQRQKVRISRDRILDSAFKVFELYGSSRASLEVEFFNEVGSGLGPTLEFYALVSKDFARKDLALWRDENVDDTSSYVHNAVGLYPTPLADATSEAGKKALKVFRVLGQFVAKALMDSRIIDVHFNKTFMKLVLDHAFPLSIGMVKTVDPHLGRSLVHLQEYADAKAEIGADESLSDADKQTAIAAIEARGAKIGDLSLDFTLPGYDIELKTGGKDIEVDITNVEEYISLVVEWTLRTGVLLQVKEFKKGFSSVFPMKDLRCFTAAEVCMLVGAGEEDWSFTTLLNATKADHGFTSESRPLLDLLSIMSELSTEERREVLAFLTGSPRLPIGGFAALSPPLTVVRKDGGDRSLPSVMTCLFYVKLPSYSSRAVLKSQLMRAVQECAGFYLS